MSVSQLNPITHEDFDRKVLKAAEPVLVFFTAPWDGQAKSMVRKLEELQREQAGKISFFELNTDESPTIVERYEIYKNPTVAIFQDGQLVAKMEGVVPKEKVQAQIEKVLSA